MAWEYLKTKPWDIRYKIVENFLPDLSDMVVIDLNCGEGNFRKYIKCKKYYANDINFPDNIDGMEFDCCPDTEVDIKSDVLCLFGYAAGQYTHTPIESKTALKSLLRLAKYKPEYIVVETIWKFAEEYGVLSEVKEKLTDYKVALEEKVSIESEVDVDHTHVGKRHIIILERKKND